MLMLFTYFYEGVLFRGFDRTMDQRFTLGFNLFYLKIYFFITPTNR